MKRPRRPLCRVCACADVGWVGGQQPRPRGATSVMQLPLNNMRMHFVCICPRLFVRVSLTHIFRFSCAVHDPFIVPTVGLSKPAIIKLPGGEVELFDVGGGPAIRGVWYNYYQDCHAVIYVIDAGDRARVGEAAEELRKNMEHELAKGKPILVCVAHRGAACVCVCGGGGGI